MHNAFLAAKFFAFLLEKSVFKIFNRKNTTNASAFYISTTLLFCCLIGTIAVVAAAPADQSLKARTKRAYAEGDIMIGVLMPMHKQSDKKNDYRQACGVIWEGYGIHRLEQFFRAVDEINARRDLLPGIKLGYDVRDSCWTIPVALEQSIDFIRNKIGTLDKQMAGAAGVDASSSSGQPTSVARGADCSPQQRGKTIAALIGPGSSTISGPIQNVLQLFEIPEIDFGATAVELSDKNKHRFFSRVVPSDKQQARVLVDIIVRHNWTYIHAVHTEGMYGENGMEEFKAMLSKTGACIAVDKKLKSNVPTGDGQYMELLNEIRSKGKDKAKVIVCFCDGGAVRGIFNATATYRRLHPDYDGKFLVIGSDGWNVREDVVKGLESTANGGISIKLHSPKIDDFETYLSGINPLKNDRNPWFQEFWEWRFNCTFDKSVYGWKKPCDPSRIDQRIDPETVEQDAKLGFVVNAVYALAHAFHNMLIALCPNKFNFAGCPHINQTINGTMVFSYLRNVTFLSYSNDSIKFDEFMDGVGRYEIMTYRYNESIVGVHGRQGAYEYQKIGWWDSGFLYLKDLVEWPNVTDEIERTIESVCSKPCEKGKVKKIQEGGVPCCWSCQQCLEHEYIISDSRCMPCQPGWWPDDNLTSCLPLEIKYKSLVDKDSIVCVVFALFGILSCAFVLIIFVRHNSTPVVKASTRELTYIILAGVFLSYLTTIPLLMKPTLVSCYFTRILPGLSFSLIYGALATKTNRIARILSGSKKKIITRKPRFLSASAQVVITCIIVGTECVIITLMLILEPADSILHYPTKKEVRLKCNTTDYGLMVPFGFDMFLIVMCTLYAVRTRNMPENFQEAKFIGFCMYTTCAIWGSFVPIYYNSESRMTTMSFCISASATAALIFLFYPKIYIMVYQPEKNTKSAFNSTNAANDSTRSRLDSFGSTNGQDYGRSVRLDSVGRQSGRESPPELKHRLSNRPLTSSSQMPSNAQLDEILADKLVEAIMPHQAPAKLPKPKTISELMQQRRMSVASVGSAERLLAAALRHTRGSMMPTLVQEIVNQSRNGSISGSQDRMQGSSDQQLAVSVEQEGDEGGSGAPLTPNAAGKNYRSRSQSCSSGDSANEASSGHKQIQPQPTIIERSDSQELSPQCDTEASSSSLAAEINSALQDGKPADQQSIGANRLLLPTSPAGPVALLLPRPSPIPEEDEEAVDNSSHRGGSSSPHHVQSSHSNKAAAVASPAKVSGAKRASLQHQASSSSSRGSSKADKKKSHKAEDSTSTTYVNLESLKKPTTSEVGQILAPPLPPKPPRLNVGSTSALASRLIDHLYSSTKAEEKLDRKQQQHHRSSPKKERRSYKVQPEPAVLPFIPAYLIPEGPPRPISPTELQEQKRGKKHGKTSSRGLRQFIPATMLERSTRLMMPLAFDVPRLLKGSSSSSKKPIHHHNIPIPQDEDTSSTVPDDNSVASSTNAEAQEPMAVGGKKAKKQSSFTQSVMKATSSDRRGLLISPLSSTSYERAQRATHDRRQRAGYTPSTSEATSPSSETASTIQEVVRVAQGLIDLGPVHNTDSLSYAAGEEDSSTASTPSTLRAVATRIAIADRQNVVLTPRSNFISPTRQTWQPGSTERGHVGEVTAIGRQSSSLSPSEVSEDTLADLPSIGDCERPLHPRRIEDLDEEEAARFREYMSNLGVDIDLTAYQSTEV